MKDPTPIATDIVRRLFEAGFVAYFAGGWVRDQLRGEISDEIDIATNAPPDVIIHLFEKTVPVGIAFGVVIVVKEGFQFEVSTFRKDHPYVDGRHPQGVDYSTPEKDAWRRDFTINGMFYDPLTKTLHDFVGGKQDLEKGIIRAIGNPQERFSEDRLRMLRAIRFAARFGFEIEESTQKAIAENAQNLFPAVSMERVWNELVKMSHHTYFDFACIKMYELGLFQTIFPSLASQSLEYIQKTVACFPYFPINCPTIILIMEFFQDVELSKREALCRYLKTTHQDIKLVDFFYNSQKLIEESHAEDVIWAHFYAHPHSLLFLQVQEAKLLPPYRLEFWEKHEKKQKELEFYIHRIQQKHPIVTSAHLFSFGIKPGKVMGILLKEAERIAINQKIKDPQIVLHALQSSSLWPK